MIFDTVGVLSPCFVISCGIIRSGRCSFGVMPLFLPNFFNVPENSRKDGRTKTPRRSGWVRSGQKASQDRGRGETRRRCFLDGSQPESIDGICLTIDSIVLCLLVH